MKYVIEYNETVLTPEFFAILKQTKQKLVRVGVITACDCPVGFNITLSCTPATESGRSDLIHFLGANYQGNNVWETS